MVDLEMHAKLRRSMIRALPFTMKQPIGQALVVALALALVTLTGCDRRQQAAAGAMNKPFAAQVSVAAAITRDVPVYLDEIGRAEAQESVSVFPQVAGKVIAVHFKEGADVKKGDLLFEIDPRPFQAALAQAEATVAQRRAEVAWAQTQWKNVEDIQSQAAISKEQYEQRRIAADTAEAQLKAADAQVLLAKLNLEYCEVRSPVDGRTGQVLIDPGNVVKANEGTLVTIQKLDPIYVDFTVTERELQDVRENMTRGTLRVEVSLPQTRAPTPATEVAAPATAPATTAPATAPATGPPARVGELTFLDNTVQPGTGTIKLRATVPNADRYFWAGQFVNVRLVLTTKKDAVLIPVVAEQISQQGPFVYVVKPGDAVDPQTGQKPTVAELRLIKPGQRQGELLVVNDGLSAGEQVVTVGQMMVQPGAPVAVTAPQQAHH
jgi:multidrug efflux system membrane fusion protein